MWFVGLGGDGVSLVDRKRGSKRDRTAAKQTGNGELATTHNNKNNNNNSDNGNEFYAEIIYYTLLMLLCALRKLVSDSWTNAHRTPHTAHCSLSPLGCMGANQKRTLLKRSVGRSVGQSSELVVWSGSEGLINLLCANHVCWC